MENGLCSLAYLSRSLMAAQGDDLEREIVSILTVSRRNNQRQSLTGALLIGRSIFAQVLEGDSDRLAETFEAIQRDPRHCDILVLHFKPIRLRVFPSWSMKRIDAPLSTAAQGILSCLSEDQAAIESGESGQALVELMVDLLQGVGAPGARIAGAGR